MSCGVVLPTAGAGPVKGSQSKCAGVQQLWRQAIARFDPDLVVMTVGPEEVLLGQYTRYSSGFKATLRAAVEQALDIFSKRGAFVVFTTVPCFGPKFDSGVAVRNDQKGSKEVNAYLREGSRLESALASHRLVRLPMPPGAGTSTARTAWSCDPTACTSSTPGTGDRLAMARAPDRATCPRSAGRCASVEFRQRRRRRARRAAESESSEPASSSNGSMLLGIRGWRGS